MTTLNELVPVLLQKSREGKIPWEQLSPTSYYVRMNDLIVEVTKVQGGNTSLRLRNESSIIESTSYSDAPAPIDNMIVELYDIARRKGLRIDEAITSLKDALDGL